MPANPAPITAKKSYKDGHVVIGIQLKCGRGFSHDNARITASTELTSAEARALAQLLIEIADKTDAKVAAKSAAEERRRHWRDREVAAGRIVVMDAKEFFRGGR